MRKNIVIVAALFSTALPAPGAPLPKTEKGNPITVENVKELRPIAEVKKFAYRIRRGPEIGQVIFLDYRRSVEVYDDRTLKLVKALGKDRSYTDFAASRDGKWWLWTTRDNEKSYSLENAETGKVLELKLGDSPGAASFSPDGKILAIGGTFWQPGAEGVGQSQMQLFDRDGKLIRTLEKQITPGHLTPVFSPDGKTLAVGNRNAETRIFDVATGKVLHTFKKQMTHEIAFSPDGKRLAAGYVDGSILVWDTESGKQLHSIKSGCSEVYSLDWSTRGDLLASSGLQGKTTLWNTKDFSKEKELDSPAWVIQVRFTADGNRLLTSGGEPQSKGEKQVTLWGLK